MEEESKETDGDMSQSSPSSNFTSRSTIIGSSDSQSSVLDLSGSVDSRVATPSLDNAWDKEIKAEKERELYQPLIELFTTPAPKFENAAVE
ncbi:hypothetical protein B484DRAFT_409575 [Ochromonadaceae sp. CCMP2298]|nr:hypothetical protein B484DRAFT_409575 [Ochromonadaceae sp. CCMP2298]